MADFEDIPPHAAAELLKAGECYVVDVRTPEEFVLHRIAGAHLLPLQELQARHAEIPREPGRKMLIYCEHGVRSLHTCQVLAQNGWQNLVNLNGGMAAWIETGLPVASGAAPDAVFLGPPATELKQ